MKVVRKCLKLSASKTSSPSPYGAAIVAAARSRNTSAASHDALLRPPPEGGGAKDGEGYLLVEEDATDSSLVITMGNTHLTYTVAMFPYRFRIKVKRIFKRHKRKMN